ncbi:MAG TPA: glycosyltransferase family 9 protein [Verrucomicrobiae bacterium]|nr:glycosyltransferase family 9 protein [Verrucomicrobiae bacterium]
MAPLLRACAGWWCGRPISPPEEWRRGLILGHTKIGDVLYRTASLEALRRGLPACEWHYLAAPDSAEVLAGNPHLASVLPLCPPGESLRIAKGGWAAMGRLGFDVALCTNPESYWMDLRIPLRLRVPNRAGFVHRGLSGVVTHPVPWTRPKPWAEYFRDMVATITGQAPVWPLTPQIFPNSDDRESARRVWDKLELGRRPVMACFMSTRQPSRVWPPDCYAQMLRQVCQDSQIEVVLAGGSSDRQMLASFARDLGIAARVTAGDMNLRAMCCFLEKCSVVFATDSGPRHIANAAGVPVVFIRNLYCAKIETGVYCPNEIDISPDVERVAMAKQEAFLRQVTPEAAARAVLSAQGKGRSGPPRSTLDPWHPNTEPG